MASKELVFLLFCLHAFFPDVPTIQVSWVLPLGKVPGTHWVGDPSAGLVDLEKRKFLTLLGLELRPLGPPAHSQSLYRLPYPSSPSPSRVKNFLFSASSRPVPGPTQPPIQWVLGAPSLGGVKRPGREADRSLQIVPRSRKFESVHPPPPPPHMPSWHSA
jgi:hypothetical protein